MMFQSTYVLVSLISVLVGIGFTVGVMVSKYQTKEKCEVIRQTCSCDRQKGADDINRRLEKLESNWSESIKRVHERLDEVLMKLGGASKP